MKTFPVEIKDRKLAETIEDKVRISQSNQDNDFWKQVLISEGILKKTSRATIKTQYNSHVDRQRLTVLNGKNKKLLTIILTNI